MAHFAKLDKKNVVMTVIVVNNDALNNAPFPDSEPLGEAFINETFKTNDVWKQTSYNNNFRKRFAGVGHTYDAELDAFIAPTPYPSWLLNTNTCQWEPPVPYPTDGKMYSWDEETQSWVEVAVD
jgi:hypothetical protein